MYTLHSTTGHLSKHSVWTTPMKVDYIWTDANIFRRIQVEITGLKQWRYKICFLKYVIEKDHSRLKGWLKWSWGQTDSLI